MKYIKLLIAICLITASCSKNKKHKKKVVSNQEVTQLDVKDTMVDKSLLTFKKEISVWTLNEKPYSGYAITKFKNGSLNRKFGLLNGKKQNEDVSWFSNGNIKSVANYHKGKLHGEKKIWSEKPTYTLVSKYQYHLGKGHGKQVKWYRTGELFQVINLNMGKEDGIQQGFRKNGKLFANYEAKNGRIFGLKKASLCFGLEDQKIQASKKKTLKTIETDY